MFVTVGIRGSTIKTIPADRIREIRSEPHEELGRVFFITLRALYPIHPDEEFPISFNDYKRIVKQLSDYDYVEV